MFREGLRPPDPFRPADPLADLKTQDGLSLKSMAGLGKVLVAFVPPRPRKLLAELVARRAELERDGYRLVLVHCDDVPWPDELRYVARLRDADRTLFRRAGLEQPGALARLRGRGGGLFDFDGASFQSRKSTAT